MTKKPFAETPVEIMKHVDASRPVKVYRNLTRKCYSVQQDGIVKCHAPRIELWNCRLRVSESGRQRVLREGRKNVHAFVVGRVSASFTGGWSTKLAYNPYKAPTFMATNPLGSRPVTRAAYVSLAEKGASMAAASLAPKGEASDE